MKYYVAYDQDSAQFQVKYGYGGPEDVVKGSYFKLAIAQNTALELNSGLKQNLN